MIRAPVAPMQDAAPLSFLSHPPYPERSKAKMRFERSTVLGALALLASTSLSATAAAQDPRPERPRLPPLPQQIGRPDTTTALPSIPTPVIKFPVPGPVLVEEYAPGRSGPRETVEFMLPGRLRPLRVEYEVIDGLAIAEGDIILGRASEMASAQRQRELCRGDVCTVRQPLMMRTGESFLWPSGGDPLPD
jgi:hypothetical protein